MHKLLSYVSWPVAVLLALTIGLAPFTPEPHIWEKLKMLAAGELTRGVDIFDMAMHGAPWLLLLAKCIDYLAHREK